MNNKQLYTIDPLFDFQLLCDIDLGLYRLIKQDYYDRSIFDNGLFDSNDELFIRTILLYRKTTNPLFTFSRNDSLSDQEKNDIYQEFLDTEYTKILDLSTPTTILKMASISNNTNNIVNVTILCRSEEEERWIKKYNSKLKCIIADYKDLDISIYDTIYIKDIHILELLDQKSIIKKNIIFGNYSFNMEDTSAKIEIPIIDIAKKYYIENKFMTIDVYDDVYPPMSEAD